MFFVVLGVFRGVVFVDLGVLVKLAEVASVIIVRALFLLA